MTRFRKVAFPDGRVERIPFTPAEEAQRDAEEAVWEADKAAREAAEIRLTQREARIKALANQPTVSRAEQDEFMNLLRERERMLP